MDESKKSIKFEDIKPQIIEALKVEGRGIGINEDVTLIDGFINQPIQKELTGGLVFGGPLIPLIAVIGKKTKRIYYYPLKAILPDLKL